MKEELSVEQSEEESFFLKEGNFFFRNIFKTFGPLFGFIILFFVHWEITIDMFTMLNDDRKF